MALAPRTKKMLERVYQIITPLLLGIGIYIVFKQGKQIEAVLLLLIGIAAIFYYWIKFFRIPRSEANDVWPPFVSTCPDYLTLVSPFATGDPQSVCMDFIGVSLKPKVMVKTNPDKIPKASDPDFESKVFRLVGVNAQQGTDNTVELCKNVRNRGLTWAHICDPEGH